MSASKRKGTAAETEVVKYLTDRGWHAVERRALNGVNDRGDIAGIPNVVIEVKNHASIQLSEFVDEAERERLNDGAEVGVAWIKRRGRSDPRDWYVAMTGEQFVELLKRAGYQRPNDWRKNSHD